MVASVLVAPGKLEVREVATPEPGPAQVRIRSAFCGICATDVAMIEGSERISYPAILGHEWSGIVESIGPGVDRSLVGARCVAENVWPEGGEVGFEHPGAYGEYFVTQADKVIPLPPALTLRQAALVEPLAVCVRGMRRLRVRDRSNALVFGDGIIGLLALILLVRDEIGEVTVVGGRDARLAKAAALGARRTVSYHEAAGVSGAALAALIRRVAPAGGFANIVEASGSPVAVEAAFALGAAEAHLLLVGDYSHGAAAVPWERWLHAEYDVMTSNASAGAWPEAVRLAGELASVLDPLITHTVPARQVQRGMEHMRSRGSVRVLIDWGVGE